MRAGSAIGANRRLAGARHELRFGPREVLVLGGAGLLVTSLAFVLGVLVGRDVGTPSRSAGSQNGGMPSEPDAAAPPTQVARKEQPLTFYRTLTAPTVDVPTTAASPARVEERIVPKTSLAERGPEAPRPATRRARGLVAGRSRPAPGPATPATGVAGAVAVEPTLWTVQVSSFRSRALADDLRARLAARGLDAYLVPAATEEGRVRYRVRVGGYPSRSEADRVASELRTERSLNPFVTLRSR